ncbi:MAG: multidrug effflux MFS transporter [Pseudomonadota bacterium]
MPRLDRTTPPGLYTLVALSGLAALNMNLFLPSLPAMAESFQADYGLVQLAVSAYLALTALWQVILGPLSDRFGRRPVMLWALVIFLGATVGCALSSTIESFLFFRMVQATVIAGLALSRAIVRDMVSQDKAAAMIGLMTMFMAIMPMIGPSFGGVLQELYGWRANFVFLTLTGVAVLALTWADLGETNQNISTSFGAQFRAYPELFRSYRFWGYTATASFASGVFFAYLGGAPYVASVLLGMSPAQVGLGFATVALGYIMGNFTTSRVSERFGIYRMILMGSILACLGAVLALVLFAVGIAHPASLFGPMLLVGWGNGMTLPSAMAGMVSVRPQLAGSASGLGGALMVGGGAALAAVTGSLLTDSPSAMPLLGMMAGSAVLGVVSALWVIRVERLRQRQAAAAQQN